MGGAWGKFWLLLAISSSEILLRALSILERSEETSEAKGDSMDNSLKISSDCLSLGSLWKSSKFMVCMVKVGGGCVDTIDC